jgi:hypothetical protein
MAKRNEVSASGESGLKRPVRRGDLIASIVLVLVAVIANVVVTATAMPLVLLTDSCDVTCNYTVIQGGFIFALVVPSVLTLIGIFITIMRVAQRKRAFWVPLATAAAAIVALVIGTAVMILGIPGAQLF